MKIEDVDKITIVKNRKIIFEDKKGNREEYKLDNEFRTLIDGLIYNGVWKLEQIEFKD